MVKIFLFFAILLVMLSLMLIFIAAKSSLSADEISIEEYKVYSDALPQLIELSKQESLLVIADHTIAGLPGNISQTPPDSYEKLLIEKLGKEIVDEFKIKNKNSHKLENKFNNELKVILVSKKELELIFGDPDTWWNEFYKRYPNSYGQMSLSRVAFNEDKNIALFYLANQRKPLRGAGVYVLLERKDNEWIIIDGILVWVS